MTFQSDAITKLIICGGKLVIATTKLFEGTNFPNFVIFKTVDYKKKMAQDSAAFSIKSCPGHY